MQFGVNRGVLIAGLVIAGTSILNQLWVKSTQKGITRIMVGTYIFILILAFVDMIPGFSPVTTALAMLAMLTTLLLYGGGILGKVNQTTHTVSPTSTGTTAKKA